MVKPPKTAAPMLTHGQVWAALDRLAERAGMSPSGLARRAGLDPTTFNKSKRITADGRERWPSTESVAKALAATNASIETFVQLIGDAGARRQQSVPLLGLAAGRRRRLFRRRRFSGRQGLGRDRAARRSNDEHAYALEISGDSMRPAFRDGDIIIVSPAAPIRRGDRVVVQDQGGEVMVKELKRRTAKTLELQSLNPAHARSHARRPRTSSGSRGSCGRASEDRGWCRRSAHA